MDQAIEEFIKIRKKFKASRSQFGEVFIGKSGVTVTAYEKGKLKIPQTVLMLARTWEVYLDAMMGKRQCRKK